MDSSLLNAVIENLRVAKRVPSSAAALIDATLALLEQQRGPLRFTCRDLAFDMFTNIACYRAMLDYEDSPWSLKELPYGIRHTASVRQKIKNYRDAYRVKLGLTEPSLDMWSTRTIRYLIDYAPTRAELDEAAKYYKTRERVEPKTCEAKRKRNIIDMPATAPLTVSRGV
jgi:hypothetical protein